VPELPEAETIARGLRRWVVGRVIEQAQVVHADVLCVSPAAFRACVRGRRIESVERRGKQVVIRLDGGRVLLVKLGMTGRLLPLLPGGPPPPFAPTHPAVRFRLQGGGTLVYDDIRRFGSLECLAEVDWVAWSETLGPEPLSAEFSAARLVRDLSRSGAPVRSWLLDQRRVAGVGNIYANEALWRARVHPARPARDLSDAEARRLHRSLRQVLERAVGARGTTLRDYRTADGEKGGFSFSLAVYGREGSPCPRCRTAVQRIVFGNRSAFLCPHCQPARLAGR
jgi:formamidopyrimidine-DNA glycosylase